MENKNLLRKAIIYYWISLICNSLWVPTSALKVDFRVFTQSYQANVGELLEIWNYRKFRDSCHIIFVLIFTNQFGIRISDMLKTSLNIL